MFATNEQLAAYYRERDQEDECLPGFEAIAEAAYLAAEPFLKLARHERYRLTLERKRNTNE